MVHSTKKPIHSFLLLADQRTVPCEIRYCNSRTNASSIKASKMLEMDWEVLLWVIEGVCVWVIFFFFAQVFRKQKQIGIFFLKNNNPPNRKCFKRREGIRGKTQQKLEWTSSSALDTLVSYLPLADSLKYTEENPMPEKLAIFSFFFF